MGTGAGLQWPAGHRGMRPEGVAGPAGATGATGAAGLIKISEVNVVADQQDVLFSSLNGNTDDIYVLDFHLQHGPTASAAVLTLQPNGLTTNQKSQSVYASGGAVSGAAYNSLVVSDAGSDVTTIDAGRLTLQAKTGRVRIYTADSIQAAAALYALLTVGRWDEAATNITSLNLHSSLADGIGIGSRFILWKLPP